MTESITITSCDELIAVVPHIIGFTPSESMVCVASGEAPSLRVDLPRSSIETDRWIETLTELYLQRHHPLRVSLLAFGSDQERCLRALETLGDALAPEGDASGPGVGPMLWVDGEEWTEVISGTRGTVDPSARARIDAEYAVQGRVMPSGTRADLVAALRGDPGGVAARVSEAGRRFAEFDDAGRDGEARWVGTRIGRFSLDRERLSDADAARVVVAVQDTAIRDSTMLDLRRADAAVLSAFWQDLVRRSPPEVRDTPATMLALTSFLDGRGAHAWVALDEVAHRDILGDLVATALVQAVDPRKWDQSSPVAAPGALLQRAALKQQSGPQQRAADQVANGQALGSSEIDPGPSAPGAER